MKTWIKFCGTTSVEDALASVEAGADALGFIFAPSKRRITIEKAQEIIRRLPAGVERIGVFMNESVDQLLQCVSEIELTGIQFHGDESPYALLSYLPAERRAQLRMIKTIIVQEAFEHLLQAGADGVDAWLLDSGAGTGKSFDWQMARTQLAGQSGRFIIAGGLRPENVGAAIRMFSPWGVDVVSGIEREPGRKAPEKMKAFVAAVRKAEQQ